MGLREGAAVVVFGMLEQHPHKRVPWFSFLWYDVINRYEQCVTVKKRRRNPRYRQKPLNPAKFFLPFLAELDIFESFEKKITFLHLTIVIF